METKLIENLINEIHKFSSENNHRKPKIIYLYEHEIEICKHITKELMKESIPEDEKVFIFMGIPIELINRGSYLEKPRD